MEAEKAMMFQLQTDVILRRLDFFVLVLLAFLGCTQAETENESCTSNSTLTTGIVAKLNEPTLNITESALGGSFFDGMQETTEGNRELNAVGLNFRSFEEWKKDKLDHDQKESSRLNYGQLTNISSKNNGTTDINSDLTIEGIQSQRYKKRESSLHHDGLSTTNDEIGEDMMIQLEMFTGKNEEQGKLYKGRYNYASIDCAATIVKTNNEAKGANSILVDNKDSYLLNECRSKNKHVVIELCEDILVDEVSIGNFEFYSSVFKDIKISVSDRFPAPQWMILGEFQAENIKKLQTFKIENPIIWAKFLKVEFLTHYGDQFYCPVSTVQVHGKTMIEQFKEENPDEEIATLESSMIEEELHSLSTADPLLEKNTSTFLEMKDQSEISSMFNFLPFPDTMNSLCFDANLTTTDVDCSTLKYLKLDQFLIEHENKRSDEQCLAEPEVGTLNRTNDQENITYQASQQYSITPKSQPQDSIYKNIVKRLSLLESNATLSLLYIEEQSKLLSSAFMDLEKQQSHKFQQILSQFNTTIRSQMEIYEKLSIDVYKSFSGLFEYQQQKFESTNLEIIEKIQEIEKSVTLYKHLTITCVVLIIVLIFYILLSKDLYLDEAYIADASFVPSPNLSPTTSPTVSRSTSVYNMKRKIPHFSEKGSANEQLGTHNQDSNTNIVPKLALKLREGNSQEYTSALNPIPTPSSSLVAVPTSTSVTPTSSSTSIVLRYRSSLLDTFSKSWSPSKKKHIQSQSRYSNRTLISTNDIQTPETSRSTSPIPVIERIGAKNTTVNNKVADQDRGIHSAFEDEDVNRTSEPGDFELVVDDQ